MLPQLSSKLIFRRLLSSVTKNTVFSFNGKLYRQTDGCGMGNPLFPVLANIFMSKLEADVVRPFNPTFYDRYVGDCFLEKRKDEPDQLLDHLNNYHPIIKFTVEENPDHFLRTLRSAMATTILTVKSIKNRGNYLHTGHQKYQSNGRGIVLQKP